MGWKQYWLFKRQRDRFITFGKVNPIQLDEDARGAEMLEWAPNDWLEKRLLKGIFDASNKKPKTEITEN